MSPEPWIKLIETIRKIKTGKIVFYLCCFIVVVAMLKFEVIAPYILPKPTENKRVSYNVIETEEILDDKINKILTSEIAKLTNSVKYLAVFEFLPTGEEYKYQGRVLVGLAHRYKISNATFVDGLNYGWIPMWSGKLDVEELLAKKTVLIKADLSGVEPTFSMNDHIYTIKSVNSSYLIALDIDRFFKYPVVYKNKTVAYIVIAYQDGEENQLTKNDLMRTAKSISKKIYQQVTKDL